MELKEIERHARALMTAHGVGSLEFAFDGGKSRLGATHIRIFNKGTRNETRIPYKITLSKHYAVLLPADEIRDVILHEIAHALTPAHNHDAVWKAAARKVGAKPQRCARPSASPTRAVVGKCDPCGKVVSEGHRLPQRIYIHATCKRALTYYRKGVKVDLNDMPIAYQQRHMYAVERGRL